MADMNDEKPGGKDAQNPLGTGQGQGQEVAAVSAQTNPALPEGVSGAPPAASSAPPPAPDAPAVPEAAAEGTAAAEAAQGAEPSSADISLDAALSKQAAEGTPLDARKKKQILYGGAALACLLLVLMMFSCQPARGSMAYGICSVFLEMNVDYPQTIQHTDYEGSYTAVRIYFTNTDAFGEFKLEMIECTFGPDEAMGMKLTQVARNRRPVEPAKVEAFNRILPVIMASDPYRVLPPNWENKLLPR
ncbi:MAG: hypothetical protein WC989_07015 [Micavibrio sp.]